MKHLLQIRYWLELSALPVCAYLVYGCEYCERGNEQAAPCMWRWALEPQQVAMHDPSIRVQS